MKQHVILTAFFFLLLNFCVAQETVYFSKDTTAIKKVKGKRSSERSIIKIAPLGFIEGSIPVFFEREINQTFSIQVGVGVTTRNYLKEWANNLALREIEISKTFWNSEFTNSHTENNNPINDFTNRKASLGYFISIQPRVYIESEGMGGGFLGIGLERARYNFSSAKINTGNGPQSGEVNTDYFKEYDNISEISVNLGSQYLYHRISMEYAVMVAIRNTKGKRYAYGYDDNGSYIDGYSEINQTTPALGLTFKVGYHF